MAVHELEVAVRGEGEGIVIALTGDLNSSSQRALEEAYAEAVAGRPRYIALDFTDADYINSTGIAVIVGLARARTQEIEIKARGLSNHYREIFEITRLSDFITIEGSMDA